MVWGFTLFRVLPYGGLDAAECFEDLPQIPWVLPVSVYRGNTTELVPYDAVGVTLPRRALPGSFKQCRTALWCKSEA